MRILIAGDFAPYRRTAIQIENGDYSCLDNVKSIIKSVDYSIVNFESPVVIHNAEPIKKTGPNLKCSENAMECIACAGFNCITLANNHFRDFGQVGVEDTIDTCSKFGMDYVGGGKTQSESEQILIKVIAGETLAIINVCEHEWSISSGDHGGSNPLDIIKVCRTIKNAKRLSKYVLIIIHGGIENYNLPTPRMKELYRFFIESGADAVVNHHQHCYSGYEEYFGKPIFYGLGNFCFDKKKPMNDILWEDGFMVELFLGEKIEFCLHPYSQCKEDKPFVNIKGDSSDFSNNIIHLNKIINNDLLLQQHFENWVKKKGNIAKDILVPYSSKLGKKLYSMNLIPSFVSNRSMRQLLAHIQCESHRDILTNSLTHFPTR